MTIAAVAQQPIRLQGEWQSIDDLRAAWTQGQHQAVISFAARQAARRDLTEEEQFMEACAAARLRTGDAESKLLRFLDTWPSSPRLNQVRYERAALYYNLKRYTEASAVFNEVDLGMLDKDLRQSGLFFRGYSLFSQKRLKESKLYFDQIKLSGGLYGPASGYYAGIAAYSEGDSETALQDFRRIQSQKEYEEVVPYLIGSCLLRLNRFDELIEFAANLDKARNIQDFDEIHLLVAEANFSKGDFEKSVIGYDQYLNNRRSADRLVFYRAGLANFKVSKFNEAAGFLKQAASDEDSIGVFAAYHLGLSYLKITQKPFALSAFQTCARSRFTNPEVMMESRYQEAKLLYDIGRPDVAIDKMESFVADYPSSFYLNEIGELLSGAYVNASHYHKAITHIESLQKRTPAADRAYQKAALYYGFEFYNKGDLQQAISFFKKSLEYPLDEPLVFEASLWIGEALCAESKWSESVPFYEKIIFASARASQEQMLKARYGLGYARFNTKDYERASIQFREFLAKVIWNDPRISDAQIRLGDSYYVMRSYQQAYEQYKRVADAGKNSADYGMMQAGVMLGILHKNRDGINLLDQMIKKFPQSVFWDEGIYHRSQLEFEESAYEQAVSGYTLLLNRKPASRFVPFSLVRRAAAYFNLKNYDQSAADYIKVLQQYPDHPAAQDILLPLQESLNLAGRGEEFSHLLGEFKKQNPDATGFENVEFETARNLYLNQEYNKAIVALNGFIKSYNDSPFLTEARFLRAESWYRQKDFSNALQGYYEISGDEKFTNAPRVSSRIAELESKSSNWENAINAFRKWMRLSASPKDTYNAWAGLMDGYFITGVYDSALFYSEKILAESGPGASLQHRAQLMNGKVYQALGDFEKAKDGYISTINEAQDEFGAQAKYYLAEIHFIQKNHRQCYETVLSLNRDYAPHTEWIGKGYLLLAESFLATGETFQAKATLQSLDQFPLPVVREEALRKLEKISKEELKKKTEPSDSTDHDD